MKDYLTLCRDVLANGELREDRTGTGTLSVFSRQIRFDMSKGFPLLTTKKLHVKSIIHELLWFLMGDTNVKYLQENGVRIWNEWADEEGDLGRVYGSQWRDFRAVDENGKVITVDQIADVINSIKNDPMSRRHLVVAYNPAEIKLLKGKEAPKLPPCHWAMQFYVHTNGILDLKFYMRSCDIFLGWGFNVASYGLLLHMVAQQCDLEVGELIYDGSDVHIYLNHIEQVKLQLEREPRPLPTLIIKRKPDSIFDYKFEDFEIKDYDPHPAIKGTVSV